jgi:hypothetical protein
MHSRTPAACPYCKQIPDVFELPEKRGHYRVACLNPECRGKLVSDVFNSSEKAIRSWTRFLSEREYILQRLRDFYSTHLAIWVALLVWNDTRRYPDLPPDSKEKPRLPPLVRNTTNEFHIRYLSSAHEAYLVLGLWNLLYDDSKDAKGDLRKLADRLLQCGVKSKDFPIDTLNDCLLFFRNRRSAKAFDEYRHNRLAHLGTYKQTNRVHFDSDLIYALVPKMTFLFEILQEELERIPSYTDNQWSTTSSEPARFFSHSGKDELLFELFRLRSLPSKEYRKAVKSFISRRNRRELKARGYPKATKKVSASIK